jgi:hypothetical protein
LQAPLPAAQSVDWVPAGGAEDTEMTVAKIGASVWPVRVAGAIAITIAIGLGFAAWKMVRPIIAWRGPGARSRGG